MIRPWRFFDTGPAPGPFNMALDEAMLTAHSEGLVPPTLRVYAWERPTLSLGYAQGRHSPASLRRDVAPLLERCRRAGLEVVRRPTGGRAILHHLEITYSVVIGVSLLGSESSITRSYRFLCAGVVAAFRSLGIQAEFSAGREDSPPLAEPVPRMCFALASRSDVVVKGAKAVGSAQARRNGVLLQHGSIPLRYDEALQTAIFGQTFRQSLQKGRITSLEQEVGRPLAYEEVAQAVKQGFESVFGGQPLEASPTESELTLGRLLAAEKYSALT